MDLVSSLCEAQVALWETRTSAQDSQAAADPRLEEANRILARVLLDAPELSLALMMRGQVRERLHHTRKR